MSTLSFQGLRQRGPSPSEYIVVSRAAPTGPESACQCSFPCSRSPRQLHDVALISRQGLRAPVSIEWWSHKKTTPVLFRAADASAQRMGAPEWAAIGASTGFAPSAKARDLPHQFTRAARSGGRQCMFCFLEPHLQFVLPSESPECTAATSPSRGEEATGQQCGSLLEGGSNVSRCRSPSPNSGCNSWEVELVISPGIS